MAEEEKKTLLTEEEVLRNMDFYTFARAMNGGDNYYGSYLTPDLISSGMRDINLNPQTIVEDALKKALSNPKSSESTLQAFSQNLEITSMVYKRLISYLTNMLAFDITYVSNAKPEDYKTPKYRKDLDTIENFLNSFDYKSEFRIVTREMLRNDAYFGCFRKVGDKYILQELPPDYCKITGRWENGFLFSFNMYWFMLPGVSIDMYPDFFKKKFSEIVKKGGAGLTYNPSLSPEDRGRSSWVYWVDVPVNVGTCFKLSPEISTRLPYFTPIFSDLIMQPIMRNLQKDMNMAAANKLLIGEVPMLHKDTQAAVKDSIAISPEVLGKYLALVRSAINDAIKVVTAPLENFKQIDFDTKPDMYDNYLRTALATSGINTNLIFTSNVKPNSIETQLSLNVDEQMMKALYGQFEAFMNYQASKLTKNFKFYFNFEGTDFFLDRKQRFDTAMTLFDKGIVLPQKIAASIGMKPSELRKQMEEASAFGFMDTLTPPSVAAQKEMATISAKLQKSNAEKATPILKPEEQKSKSRGRPRKDESEIGDEGLATRDEGENIGRGGKI